MNTICQRLCPPIPPRIDAHVHHDGNLASVTIGTIIVIFTTFFDKILSTDSLAARKSFLTAHITFLNNSISHRNRCFGSFCPVQLSRVLHVSAVCTRRILFSASTHKAIHESQGRACYKERLKSSAIPGYANNAIERCRKCGVSQHVRFL